MKKDRFCKGCLKTPVRADNTSGYCTPCLRSRAKKNQPPADTLEVRGDTAVLTKGTAEKVRTLEDLIRICEIDTSVWTIERWTCAAYQQGAKDAEGQLNAQELFSIKAWLKANKVIASVKQEIASLLECARLEVARAPRPSMGDHLGVRAGGAHAHLLEIAIPDLHLGKLAWKPETGYSDYDVKIAEKLFDTALEALIERTKHFTFDKIVFPVGNDLLHSDTKHGTTTKGTPLDTDSRYYKAFAIGRRMISRAIDKLRLIAPVTVVCVAGNHDCHDFETDILTRRGWTKFHDLRDDDQVLSLDKSSRGVWSNIAGKVLKPHVGNMHRIVTQNLDMRVTPTHRIMCRPGGTEAQRGRWEHKNWRYVPAKNLSEIALHFPVAAKTSANAGIDLCDDQIALAAWILTDGSIRRKGNHVSISLFQSKDGTEIQRLLCSLGLFFKKTVRQRNITHVGGKKLVKRAKPQVEWRLDAESSRIVTQWLPKKGSLPSWANDLSDAQWTVFMDAAIAGDGSWSTESRRKKSKTSAMLYGTKPFLESFQTAAVQHGWRAWISPNRLSWKLNLAKRDFACIASPKNIVETTTGEDVWCLIVPHGNFMVRRNDKPHFSGNCLSTYHLSDSLSCLYGNDPGVIIMGDPILRKYVAYGRVALMFTHGDKGKSSDWPLLFATEQPKMFGSALYREIHIGHLHQTRTHEYHGVRVRISPALCSSDAWHSDNQFVGNLRGAEALVWHPDEGLVATAHFSVKE